MRILGLVPYPFDKAPGQRYRMEQWAPSLAQYGVDVTFESFRCPELHELLCRPGNNWRKVNLTAQALVRRLKVLRQIKNFDLIYIYNEAALLGPALVEQYISSKGVPFVFDFDDAIFLHYTYISPVNRYLRLLKCPGKTASICRMASRVIVGNSYLGDYALKFNKNVTIVPSTVDTDSYTLEEPVLKSEPLVIAWTGSYSTIQYLDTLRNVFLRLAKFQNFKLRVIGVPDYRMNGINVEAIPWKSETEVADLRGIDIGIMPMPDDEWTRGKCGMKALQFMALGIPTVCAPVGVNSRILRQNENGLLAANDDEWVDSLSRLLNSTDLRARLGKEGRATIEANYSKAVHVPRVFRILEAALNEESFSEVEDQRAKKVEIMGAAVLNDKLDA